MSEAIAGLPRPPPPSPPKDASAVVLYRRTANGVEVFWLKRDKSLRFAPGFFAFPGGKVDAADARQRVIAANEDDSRLVIAAARELFEETGVLKVRGPIPSAPHLEAARRSLLEGSLAFTQLLEQHSLIIHAHDFTPAGRWVTPAYLPHRFDARFFLTECPPEQNATVWKGELEWGEWIPPRVALERWSRAEVLLHPPNLHALQVMATFDEHDATARRLASKPVEPSFVTHRIEFQRGVLLFPLETPTLPPASFTNCYLLGTGDFVIVDPGATEASEMTRLLGFIDELRAEGRHAKAVVLTHHHLDHLGGAERLSTALSLPVWAHELTLARLPFRPAHTRALSEGDVIELDDMRWHVLHTPGHARGHLTFVDQATRSAIVGDMVAGLGTIVIDPPEGDMAEYLRQLERLKSHVAAIYPAHGPVIPLGVAKLDEYLAHRKWRENKVLAALEAAPLDTERLVSAAYDDVESFAWPIAERTTNAILDKLMREQRVRLTDNGWSLTR